MIRRAPVLGLLLLIAAATPLRAQGAGDVLSAALASWEERMEDVHDYTLTHRVMGVETVTYFEREEGSDRPVYRTRSQTRMGGQVMASGQDDIWSNPYELFPRLAERARYEGEDRIEGVSTRILVLEEFDDLGLDVNPQDEGNFQPTEGRFWIDPESGVLRRMEVTGTLQQEEQTSEITTRIDMLGYQLREGLLEPARVVITTTGIAGALSAEDQAQARQGLEQMRRQLEQMPPDRREMVEPMIARQIEQLESMLDSGTVEVVVELVGVAVNEGPPPGLEAEPSGG